MRPNSGAGIFRVIFTLTLVLFLFLVGYRVKSALRQSAAEMDAIFPAERYLGLDQLEKLADAKIDDGPSSCITEYNLAASQTERLVGLFFSPYFICEATIEAGYASSPLSTSSLTDFINEQPGFSEFSENLVSHIASSDVSSEHFPPASDTVVFSKAEVTFEEIHNEALKWYMAGRYLAENGRGKDAIAVFTGIFDLAIAYENKRLSHPDKARRRQSCFLIEIAAVGFIENAARLIENKSDLMTLLEELNKRSNRMAKIQHVLAFDKKIPFAFGQQIAKEEAEGKTEAKYGRKLPVTAALFSDQKGLHGYLDLLYDPLIESLEHPYAVAQRAFNPWNTNYAKIFSNLEFESTWSLLSNLLFPGEFLRIALLASFAENIPFHVLLDIKTRQLIEGAKATLIINVFKKETGKWPASLKELEDWFEGKLPQDLIRNQPMQFFAGDPPKLFSIGRDGRAKTADDLVFVPFGQKVEE